MTLRRATGAVVSVLGLGASPSCASATELIVEVELDARCTDLGGVALTVGALGELESRPPATQALACDPQTGRIGSVVVTPVGGKSSEVAIRVTAGLGRPVAECVPPYGPGCIVARRALRFVAGASLVVRVRLNAVCEGIPCGATETCSGTKCVGAGDTGAIDGARITWDSGCGDMSGLGVNSPWPMYRGCPTRIARSPLPAPKTVKLLWRLPGEPWSYPGIVVGGDGMLFATTGYRGFIRAVTPSGVQRWLRERDSTEGLALTASGGVLVNTGAELSPADGSELRKYVAGGASTTGAVVDGRGNVYWSADGWWTHAFDKTGKLRWAYAAAGSANGAPALNAAQDTLYVPAADGFLHALDAATGALRWKAARGAPTGGDPDATAAVGPDGLVYAGSAAGLERWAADGTPGKTLTGRGAFGPAFGKDGTIYLVAGGSLYAYAPDGTQKWRVFGSFTQEASVVIDRDDAVLICGNTKGDVVALDTTGAELWRYPTGASGRLTGEATIGPGRVVYAVGADGAIYALASAD